MFIKETGNLFFYYVLEIRFELCFEIATYFDEIQQIKAVLSYQKLSKNVMYAKKLKKGFQ